MMDLPYDRGRLLKLGPFLPTAHQNQSQAYWKPKYKILNQKSLGKKNWRLSLRLWGKNGILKQEKV